MTHGVAVRDATDDDVVAIRDIIAAAFPLAHRDLLPAVVIDTIVAQTCSLAAVRRSVAAAMDDQSAHFLVAMRHGQILGFADYHARGGEAELHRIYVAPAAVGSGVGSALLDELHRRLPPGATYILMVAAGNHEAIGFYKRHGFARQDTVDGLGFYGTHMGVTFPPDASPVPALVLRRSAAPRGRHSRRAPAGSANQAGRFPAPRGP